MGPRTGGCGGPERAFALPGAGAAGGLGVAFLALGAQQHPGVEVVAEAVGLDAAVAGADLVLTGEGSIDEQTLAGKVPAGVAAIAARHGVPVIAFGGRVDPGEVALLTSDLGLADVVEITPPGAPLAEALRAGAANPLRARSGRGAWPATEGRRSIRISMHREAVCHDSMTIRNVTSP